MKTRIRAWKAVAIPAAVLALAACGHDTAPMPAEDANPEQVVRAYVAAVNAGDCDTAKKLATDPNTDTWCGKGTITTIDVVDVTPGTKADGSPDATRRTVNTRITTHGGDGSLADGEHTWSYLLEPVGPHGTWRIYSQGQA